MNTHSRQHPFSDGAKEAIQKRRDQEAEIKALRAALDKALAGSDTGAAGTVRPKLRRRIQITVTCTTCATHHVLGVYYDRVEEKYPFWCPEQDEYVRKGKYPWRIDAELVRECRATECGIPSPHYHLAEEGNPAGAGMA